MEIKKKLNSKNIFRLIGILATVAILATSAIVWSFAPKKDLKPSEYITSSISYTQAMQDKKPFVVLFYADWCTYCMRFMPKFKVLTDVYKDRYNFVMINAEAPGAGDLISNYAVGGFPTIYIIDPTIDNRILINNTLYDDLGNVRTELDRYLRIRAMIK
jgi:thiol-disulfide isomerase/thioredoxin